MKYILISILYCSMSLGQGTQPIIDYVNAINEYNLKLAKDPYETMNEFRTNLPRRINEKYNEFVNSYGTEKVVKLLDETPSLNYDAESEILRIIFTKTGLKMNSKLYMVDLINIWSVDCDDFNSERLDFINLGKSSFPYDCLFTEIKLSRNKARELSILEGKIRIEMTLTIIPTKGADYKLLYLYPTIELKELNFLRNEKTFFEASF